MPIEYSIWFVPKGDTYKKLKAIIDSLAQKYKSVPFEPHITLIGAGPVSKEEMIQKTQNLSSIKPFMIHLKTVSYLSEFYRSLFIKAEQSEELLTINKNAREIFLKQNDPIFMPHLSLLYGNYEEQTKKEIIQEIGKKIDVSFEVSQLTINEFINQEDFDSVKKWNVIAQIPLTG